MNNRIISFFWEYGDLLNSISFLQVYKRKTEAAKKEYLKALAAYKDNQECQVRGLRQVGI